MRKECRSPEIRSPKAYNERRGNKHKNTINGVKPKYPYKCVCGKEVKSKKNEARHLASNYHKKRSMVCTPCEGSP